MMKNENGITLVSLVVTVIVLMILTGMGVSSIYLGINEFTDNVLNTELGMVRQIVVEQYQKAKAVNKLEVPTTEEPVNFWVGEKIEGTDNLGFEAANTSQNYQEDFYYRLDSYTLEELGLTDAEHTYIVNYKTGEVYNESAKNYSNGKLLYLGPVNNSEEVEIVDDGSFNDW